VLTPVNVAVIVAVPLLLPLDKLPQPSPLLIGEMLADDETFELLRATGLKPYLFDGKKLIPRKSGERNQNCFFLTQRHFDSSGSTSTSDGCLASVAVYPSRLPVVFTVTFVLPRFFNASLLSPILRLSAGPEANGFLSPLEVVVMRKPHTQYLHQRWV